MRAQGEVAAARRPEVPSVEGGWPLLGDLPAMRADPLGLLRRAAGAGDVVRLRLGRSVYLLNHPDHAGRVLVENPHNYRKSFFYERMRPLVGDGLLTSDGATWKRHRRLAQPAFHRERLAGFVGLMARHAAAMLDGWAPRAARGEPVDVAADLMRLTLGVVGEALFGADLEADAEATGRALTDALRITNDRFWALVVLPPWLPTPAQRRFERALRVLDGLVARVLQARRGQPPRDDLLGLLMAARDADDGEGLDDRELRDEAMTLVLAGHETTANALAWAFAELSAHPEADRRLAEAARAALGGRPAALDDLPRLSEAARVGQEAMRLHPPAWIFGREAREADAFGPHLLPAGATVSISPWLLHRDPRFWADPERFDPERFQPGPVAARPRHCYLPFAAGPRMCIGHAFATLELQVVLAMAADRYRLEPVAGRPPLPEAQVTLRPRGGLWLRPRARARS